MSSARFMRNRLVWVAGYAESAVVAYVVSLAKRTTNAAALAKQLQGAGLPDSSATQTFASDLLARVPRAGAAVNTYKQQEKAAIGVARKNRRVLVTISCCACWMGTGIARLGHRH